MQGLTHDAPHLRQHGDVDARGLGLVEPLDSRGKALGIRLARMELQQSDLDRDRAGGCCRGGRGVRGSSSGRGGGFGGSRVRTEAAGIVILLG